MDPDDLLNAIGLLMTQLRVSRRALEDIERSTARYNSFAFASALSAGATFGAPPMFGGALKVWVVNINDLAPGAGGGFLEQLMGGIGRFIGGLGGGVVGGVLGGLALPDMISAVQKIVDGVDRILARLGVNLSEKKDDKDKAPQGPGLLDTIVGLKDMFKVFTALFLAASNKPEEAEKTSSSMTPGAERWLAIVKAAHELIQGIDRVVQGLILLIPVLIGALAELITRLDTIKLAIIDMVQFLLRELFLLRGVVLVTVFDTLSAVAKLASAILGILSVAVNSIAGSVFSIFGEIFKAAIAAIKFISDGLQTTIDKVVRWLVDVIGSALFSIGDSLVFRELIHVVQMLPAILPPLVLAFRGESAAKSLDTAALEAAAKITTAPPALPGTGPGSATLPGPTMISDTLLAKKQFDDLNSTVDTARAAVKTELSNAFGTAGSALELMAKQLEESAKDKTFTNALGPHIEQIKKNSDTLAGALKLSEDAAVAAAAKGREKTGLDIIAEAYEKWLQGPGLKSLLDNVTEYFRRPEAPDAFKDRAYGPSTIDRPRATIDIQDVIIQLEPPPPVEKAPEPGLMSASATQPEESLKLLVELIHELSERGFKFNAGSMLLQV